MLFPHACRFIALYLVAACMSGCRACDSKTTVPFKRSQPEAAAPRDAGAEPQQAETDTTSYPEGTPKIRVGETTVERANGLIYAAISGDVDGDKRADVMLISTDDQGKAKLEVVLHDAARASAELLLSPEPIRAGCRAVSARLSRIAPEFQLASVDFLCDAAAAAAPDQPENNDAPPEPSSAQPMTQYFVTALEGTRPILRLRLCADWAGRDEPIGSEFTLLGSDIDGDQQPDVQAALQLTEAEAVGQVKPLVLTWLNRPTGLARERSEPEVTLVAIAQEALKRASKTPQVGLPLAQRALRLHQLLCKESGAAELWTDDGRGIACGPSSGAGKAAAAAAIANAQNQALLPALDARALLEDPAYTVDKKTREQVNQAIGAIRGDTNYRWLQGPMLRPASAPNLHLPALGFSDENTLLLRGPITQAYDLSARTVTPTGAAGGGVLAADPQSRFVLTDIVRSCDGYHVRSAPFGRVIGGVVTGPPASEPLLSPSIGVAPGACAGVRPHSDRGGYVLLGMLPNGALFARGRRLFRLPFDASGQFNQAAEEMPNQTALPPLLSPGALDQSARYFALAVSEGVALIDRVQNSARLVRTPASCATGQVSDAVLSPSAHKLAMLCGGRVYVAEPAAPSGAADRP